MSFQNQGVARLRGIIVGAAVFCGILWAAGHLPGSAFDRDNLGRWLASEGIVSIRTVALVVAAIMAGMCSSLATRDYVSGTSILALSLGAALAAIIAPTRDRLFPGDEFQTTIALFIEVMLGLATILAGYFAAWQTDLHWVLPRRPGPPYKKKVVGSKELFLINVPCMFLAAGLIFGVFFILQPTFGGGFSGLLLWAASSATTAFLLLWVFPIRSTFFLWTAPGLSLLLIVILATSAPALLSLSGVLEKFGSLPFNLYVPVGAGATTLAYLLQRRLKAPPKNQANSAVTE